MTQVTGKWHHLLFAGDDGVYDKKTQRFAKDNKTALKLL